jgi:hypothetical protein
MSGKTFLFNADKIRSPCLECSIPEDECPNKKRRRSYFSLEALKGSRANFIKTLYPNKAKQILEELNKLKNKCRNFKP